MSTPHNEAKKGQIAKTVLMPGDPLRAKFIAENFLEDAEAFNHVRNMLGYTGTYEGKKISVMGSGMGMPSIGIYSYELFHFYGVSSIIRVGSCGSFSEQVAVRDLMIAMGACTDGNYAAQYRLPGTFCPIADWSGSSRGTAPPSGARPRYVRAALRVRSCAPPRQARARFPQSPHKSAE